MDTQSAIPTLPDATIAPIETERLDKDNRKWAQSYVAGLRERLEQEQANEPSDPVLVAYIQREIATYDELLARFA